MLKTEKLSPTTSVPPAGVLVAVLAGVVGAAAGAAGAGAAGAGAAGAGVHAIATSPATSATVHSLPIDHITFLSLRVFLGWSSSHWTVRHLLSAATAMIWPRPIRVQPCALDT